MRPLSPKLPTTSVGSFPKPENLMKARALFQKGKISPQELNKLEREATEFWIRTQEEMDYDLLVDGEMYRGDMATYFAENIKGCVISEPVRSYGNRYYKKPIIVGPIERPRSITVEWFQFAQSLTSRPIIGMLTGPYTLMDWSFNEYYPNRARAAQAWAEVIRLEAQELEAAGARFIQIDEPAISARVDELNLAI
ncbi:MAG: methionine synthase, partial [Candidatus Tectomicrobia bacterium]|nr:methionine synthase [Candidatus Tectomicrobia bacterium]